MLLNMISSVFLLKFSKVVLLNLYKLVVRDFRKIRLVDELSSVHFKSDSNISDNTFSSCEENSNTSIKIFLSDFRLSLHKVL